MSIPLLQIDAFTSELFRGNPAGVCFLDKPADAAWMQTVAAEMNLSETAFLVPQSRGFDLRWFTPTTEVDLCGHATLASAHALWDTGRLRPDKLAIFHTRSGELTCRKDDNWIEMNFPADVTHPATEPAGLADVLGTKPVATYRVTGPGGNTWFVELANEQTVRDLAPNIRRLMDINCGSIIVTSRATTAGFDFVSRCFFPAQGIDEDPVTGSAHCSLAPFWAAKLGKSPMMAMQVSKRGGVIKVALAGERVKISGQAVTVFRAELLR